VSLCASLVKKVLSAGSVKKEFVGKFCVQV